MYLSMFLGPNVGGAADDTSAIDLSIEQALIADKAGFTAVYLGEQHFNNYEPYSNPIVMAAYLAANVEQAYLGTSMIPLVIHHPLRLVERINLLDRLTRGRAIFGMSRGRPRPDPAFPLPDVPGGLSALFENKLQVMLRAWDHKEGDPALQFDTGAETGTMLGRMMPSPYRRRPLFAIGTGTSSTIRESGRLGRLVHTAGSTPAATRALIDVYREGMTEGGIPADVAEYNVGWFLHTKAIFVGETDAAAAAEAEPLLLTRQLPPWIVVPPEQENMTLAQLLTCDPGPMAPHVGAPESLAAFTQRSSIVGSPETVAAKLREFEDAGVPHMHARFVFGPLDDVDPFRRSLDMFVNEVVPRIKLEQMPAPGHDEIATF